MATRLSAAGEALVSEAMAELGMTERPVIVFGGLDMDLDGLFEPAGSPVSLVR